MSGRLRVAIPLALAGIVVAVALASWGRPAPGHGEPPTPSGSAATGASGLPLLPDPTPTPRPPEGGTELYGYLPYWQMNGTTADHLASTPVTTIGLFSVTARRSGELNRNPSGYRRITGDIGRRLIREAHDRGARVELVFTSFGETRNGRLFGRLPGPRAGGSGDPASSGAPAPPTAPVLPPWHRTVDELVALVVDLGLDGINVDVERLDPIDRTAYGEFLTALGAELRAAVPGATLTVATEAGERGTANAAVAAAAGVDRVFLMGYDYHWAGSAPGASSPVDRLDGIPTLRRSIARYVEAGVPRDRILLGLPLYGMTWRSSGPGREFGSIGNGVAFLPHRNVDRLLDPSFSPTRDEIEIVEWFAEPDGDEWLLTYYDSPATLRVKLALARDQGLAGGGFWALGYDRGLPAYGGLMTDFVAGAISRTEAPPSR